MEPTDILAARLAERIAELGISEREASLNSTGSPDAIRFIRTRGTMPSASRMMMLAKGLGVTIGWLMGEQHAPKLFDELRSSPEEVFAETARTEEAARDFDKILEEEKERYVAAREEDRKIQPLQPGAHDIIVFETIKLNDGEFEKLEGGVVSVPQFRIKHKEAARFIRPGFARGRDAYYGIRTPVESMEPAISENQPIIMSIDRGVRRDDYVLVALSEGPSRRQETIGIIGRLALRDERLLIIEQFNPPAKFKVPTADVADIHSIYRGWESFLLGT